MPSRMEQTKTNAGVLHFVQDDSVKTEDGNLGIANYDFALMRPV
jgi:hypothetical protein